jgi:hypothetical protein
VISIRMKLAQARAVKRRAPGCASPCTASAIASATVTSASSRLHHGRRRLREMDRHKWRAMHHVLKRTGHDVTVYLDVVRALEDRVRPCCASSSTRHSCSSSSAVRKTAGRGSSATWVTQGTTPSLSCVARCTPCATT